MTTKEIVKPSSTALVDYGEYADMSTGLDADQRIIPWLSILQAGSPQVKKGEEKYVRGAEAGMIYDSSLGLAYAALASDDEPGVWGLLCAHEHVWGVWRPRDLDGGGPRGKLSFYDDAAQDYVAECGSKFDLGRYDNKSGKWSGRSFLYKDEECELVEEYHLYLIYGEGDMVAENAMPAVISASSTQIKPARELINKVDRWHQQYRAPDFAFPFLFRTAFKKDGEYSWYVWKPELSPLGASPRDAMLRPDNPLFLEAAEVFKLHRSGQLKTDDRNADVTRGDADSDEAPF